MNNIISFPNFNLKFEINKVALNIFGIEIYWYAIIIIIAMIVALVVLKINEKKYSIKFADVLDLAIYIIPISIICARIYYVIFNLDYFKRHIYEIFNLRSGGLAIYGGIIGGIITVYIFCKKRNINFLEMLDYIAPSLAIGQAIGRWGNFVNVEAYGIQTNSLFKMGIMENGIYKEVHPTFLYESITTLIIFLITMKLSKNRKFNGEIAYIYFMLYSLSRMVIEGMRIDSLMLYNFRISQILSVVIFVVTCIILKNKSKKIYKNV